MNKQLTFRHEMKYYINPQQHIILANRLKHLISLDQHAQQRGEYHIRSLYFDDMTNSALHDKLGGIADRAKYRIRIYNQSDSIIHLEKKIKKNEYIAKLKAEISKSTCEQIMIGNYEILSDDKRPFIQEFYEQIKFRLLKPVVIVDYVREPYVYKHGNVRITFDKQLRTGLNQLDIFDPSLQTVSVLDDNKMILEIKYDGYLPGAIQAALQMEGLFRTSASKYVMCRKYNKTNNWEDY